MSDYNAEQEPELNIKFNQPESKTETSKPKKETKTMNATKTKAATKKTKATKNAESNGTLTAKQQAVIDFLKSKKAINAKTAVINTTVWEIAGFTVIIKLKDLGLVKRADEKDGTKKLFLTPAGLKLASK